MTGQRVGGRVEEIIAAQKAYREVKKERDQERQHTNDYIELLHKMQGERDEWKKRTEALKNALKDVARFNSTVSECLCWCNRGDDEFPFWPCSTPACINARDALK